MPFITTSAQLIWLGLSRRLRTIQRELGYIRQAVVCTRFQDCGLHLASERSLTLDQPHGILSQSKFAVKTIFLPLKMRIAVIDTCELMNRKLKIK